MKLKSSLLGALLLSTASTASYARVAHFSQEQIIINNGFDLSGIELTVPQATHVLELIVSGKRADAERYLNNEKIRQKGDVAGLAALNAEITRLETEGRVDKGTIATLRAEVVRLMAGGGGAGGAGDADQIRRLQEEIARLRAGGGGGAAVPPDTAALQAEIAELKRKLAMGGAFDPNAIPPELKKKLDDIFIDLKSDKAFDEGKINSLIEEITLEGSAEGASFLLDEAAKLYEEAKILENEERRLRANGQIAEADQALAKMRELIAKADKLAGKFAGNTGVIGEIYKKNEDRKEALSRETLVAKAENDFNIMKAKNINQWNSPFHDYLKLDARGFLSIPKALFATFTAVLNQTSKEELGAIIYHTVKGIKFNPKGLGSVEAQKDPQKVFYNALFDRYTSFDIGSNPPVTNMGGVTSGPDYDNALKIKQALRNYVPIDFQEISDTIKASADYKASFDAVKGNLDNHIKDSPICLFIDDKPLKDYKDFSDYFNSKIDEVYNYATLQELKAVIYHLTMTQDIKSASGPIQNFYKKLLKIIQERTNKGENDRLAVKNDIAQKVFKGLFEKARDGYEEKPPAKPAYNPAEYNRLKAAANGYQAQKNSLDAVYINTNKKDSPLLGLIEVDAKGFEKVSESDIKALEKAYLTATLGELKGIFYHLLESEEPFKQNEETIKLAISLEKIISTRAAEGKGDNHRPKKAGIGERNPINTTINGLK